MSKPNVTLCNLSFSERNILHHLPRNHLGSPDTLLQRFIGCILFLTYQSIETFPLIGWLIFSSLVSWEPNNLPSFFVQTVVTVIVSTSVLLYRLVLSRLYKTNRDMFTHRTFTVNAKRLFICTLLEP